MSCLLCSDSGPNESASSLLPIPTNERRWFFIDTIEKRNPQECGENSELSRVPILACGIYALTIHLSIGCVRSCGDRINGVGDGTAGVNVGIGTPAPKAKLHVKGGDVFIASPNSLIITSPNGSCLQIRVGNPSGGQGALCCRVRHVPELAGV